MFASSVGVAAADAEGGCPLDGEPLPPSEPHPAESPSRMANRAEVLAAVLRCLPARRVMVSSVDTGKLLPGAVAAHSIYLGCR